MQHSLAHVVVFMQVVEARSFTLAGRKLGLSKATVSKHITSLEQLLGARLLTRTTRRIGLTEAGAGFYRHCRNIVNEVDAAEAEVRELSGAPRGRLRLSASTAFGSPRTAAMLQDFLRRYPDIDVDLRLTNEPLDLVGGDFDVAICIARDPPHGRDPRRFAPYPRVVCAAPAYLDRHGTPRLPADLASHECLDCAEFGPVGKWHLEGPRGMESVAVRGRLFVNDCLALRTALTSGLGLGLLPVCMLSDGVAASELRVVLPDFRDTAFSSYVLHPYEDRPAPKVEAFIEHLEMYYQHQPCWNAELLPPSRVARRAPKSRLAASPAVM